MELIHLEIAREVLNDLEGEKLQLRPLFSECSEALCVVLLILLERRRHTLRSVQLRVVGFSSTIYPEGIILEFLNGNS